MTTYTEVPWSPPTYADSSPIPLVNNGLERPVTMAVSLTQTLNKIYQVIRIRPCIDCYSDEENCGCNCGCFACFRIPNQSRRSEGMDWLLLLFGIAALILLSFGLGMLIYWATAPAAVHSSLTTTSSLSPMSPNSTPTMMRGMRYE